MFCQLCAPGRLANPRRSRSRASPLRPRIKLAVEETMPRPNLATTRHHRRSVMRRICVHSVDDRIVNADHPRIAARLPPKIDALTRRVLHRAVPVQMIRRDMISRRRRAFSDGAKFELKRRQLEHKTVALSAPPDRARIAILPPTFASNPGAQECARPGGRLDLRWSGDAHNFAPAVSSCSARQRKIPMSGDHCRRPPAAPFRRRDARRDVSGTPGSRSTPRYRHSRC